MATPRRLAALLLSCVVLALPAWVIVSTPRSGASRSATTDAGPTAPPVAGRDIILRRQDGPLIGEAAPDVSFTTFSGKRVKLGTYLGEPVVLNFFASWCPSCRDELPQLAILSAVLYARVPVLAVAVHDQPSDAEAFVGEVIGDGGFLEVGADTKGDIASAYLVLGAPGTVVIGPDGTVDADWRGPVSQQTLLDFLRAQYPDIVVPAAGPGTAGGG